MNEEMNMTECGICVNDGTSICVNDETDIPGVVCPEFNAMEGIDDFIIDTRIGVATPMDIQSMIDETITSEELYRHHSEGVSYRELSELTGLNVNTVKSKIRRYLMQDPELP